MQRNRAPQRVSELAHCQRKRVQLTQALQRLGLRADGYCWWDWVAVESCAARPATGTEKPTPLKKPDAKYPTREELHDRDHLR